MFPVSDVIRSRTTPLVTIALITVTSVAFLYEALIDRWELQGLVSTLGVTPADLTWPTFVTSLFLHAGWIHFGANMLYLWIFGDNVEDAVGRMRFLMLYLVCGAAGAAGHSMLHPSSSVPLIGASGAVAGIMGAYLVLYPRSRVLTAIFVVVYSDLVEVPAIFFLGLWFLIQLFSNVGSVGAHVVDGPMAFWSHVVGFGAGALSGLYLKVGEAALRRYWR